MKRFGLILFLMILVPQAYSNCLTRHIQEALELNHNRKKVYSLLSEKKSEPISNAMIKMENELLLQMKVADFYTLHWRRMGIGLLCDEIIEMNQTPAFRASYHDKDPLQPMTLNAWDLQKTIQQLMSQDDFEGLEIWSHQQVLELQAEPRANCLTRHFLESIRRAAGLAPLHAKKAAEQNLNTTRWVSRQFILRHSKLLPESVRIDQMAYPLQKQGLPIICQDVPYIPRATRQSSSHLSL